MLPLSMLNAQTTTMSGEKDPFLWLEDVEGAKALAWVEKQNMRSEAQLQADPAYRPLYDAALAILDNPGKLPYVRRRGDYVYNFWRDDSHERGLWRRTSLASYQRAKPKWETILDVDALAKAEGRNWVFKGANCYDRNHDLCMVTLSDGGKDASVLREFSIADKRFVEGGFVLPEAKSSAAWLDADTLLVGTDWGEGSLTESGYARQIKALERGKSLADARLVFSGKKEDVIAWPVVSQRHDGDYAMVYRAETFLSGAYYLIEKDGTLRKLGLPKRTALQGILGEWAVVSLQQDWRDFKNGDLIVYAIADDTAHLVLRVEERQAISSVSVTKTTLVVKILDNVVSKIATFTARDPKAGQQGWQRRDVALPGSGVATIISTDDEHDSFIMEYESPIMPPVLYMVKAGKLEAMKKSPAYFDTEGMDVIQRSVASKDGTQIPYFVIGKKDVISKGNAPVHLYAYGGFEIPILPTYTGVTGKLWLESGGVFVIANIRGGGEFGPAWHQAALREKRQTAYDDFFAVAQALIREGVTNPQKLVASGGSNGGLLMGVALTQRPDLFAGIFCVVPLLDMLRFHKLLAGASWVAEYGDPDKAEDRAHLLAYSPYQALGKKKPLTSVFFYTSTKDDRVHPGHARKMAAKMQALGLPFLYYENTEGGHAAASNNRQVAKRYALQYTYFSRIAGFSDPAGMDKK